MNRIGGPSGLPHSRTCSRRPPPPVPCGPSSARSACCSSCATAVISCLLGSSTRSIDRRRGRSRSASGGGPYLAARRPIFVRSGCLLRAGRAILAGWRLAPARCSSDAHASSRSSSARSMRRAPGAARPSSSPARRASARPGSRPSWRARPRRGIRGPARALDRSRRHGAALPAVRRGSAPARGASAGRRAARGLAAAGVRGDARAAHRPRGRRARCCSCSRICTGPTRRRSISSSSSRTTSTTGGSCCSATYRADEPVSAERMRRLADGVRRSGSALVLELGPARAGRARRRCSRPAPTPRCRRRWPTRSSPARRATRSSPRSCSPLPATVSGELPRGLRDLLLRRVAAARPPTQSLLRLAAAAGRDVGYPLLRAAAGLPERDVRESLRQAVEHGVLVADQATGSFRFRHALLAEAIYATILPGEREELHARLAEELARSGAPRRGGARAALGGGGSHARGARRVGRGGAPGGGRLRPGRGSRAPRAGARAVGRRAGRGRARRARPRRALLLDGRAGRPTGAAAARGRARPASDRARRRGRPARAALLHVRLGRVPPSRRAAATLLPRRVRARGRARAGAAALAGARVCAGVARGRADAGLALRGVAADLPSRRSRSPGTSAHARPRSGRSPCSAATSPTSAAATRASRIFVRPCSSPSEIGDPAAWTGRTSSSPTR